MLSLKINNEYGFALNLNGIESVKLFLPRDGGGELEKSNYKVLDAAKGEIEVELSDFDVQGLNVGLDQTMKALVKVDGVTYSVVFLKTLNVEFHNERKLIA